MLPGEAAGLAGGASERRRSRMPAAARPTRRAGLPGSADAPSRFFGRGPRAGGAGARAAELRRGLRLHRKLIELGERSPELYYNAGLICQKRGETNDAVMFYQQALSEDPQFAEALLNLGHALMALGQEEEARSYWRKAIREKPELAQMYFEPPTAQ